MKDDIATIISNADIKDWKNISVQFGKEFLDIVVPPQCVTLNMKKMPCLTHSKEGIAKALSNPTGSPTIPEIIRSKGKPASETTVCITVSDITRPVPYRGENGILLPLLEIKVASSPMMI